MNAPQPIQIPCDDGVRLSGAVYRPSVLKAAVMVAPATGIKKRFYHAFACFLAERGYGVVCYDNRGIAESLHGPINDSRASLVSWGRLDMTAVLETMKEVFPNCRYHLVGHSAGGQLAGLMKNAADLTSMFNVACSSGSLRNMRFPFRIGAVFFMNVAIPLSNFLFGHTKSQWFGMGEALPRQVGEQWARWCNAQGYIKVDLDKTIHEHSYDTLAIPSRWLAATDDPIACEANVREMIGVYSKIESEVIVLEPRELGFDEIGHMGFFSSKRKSLWEYAADWMDGF
jgi:predicted alpha/beta hydrolase